jgi:hypothetical protein
MFTCRPRAKRLVKKRLGKKRLGKKRLGKMSPVSFRAPAASVAGSLS